MSRLPGGPVGVIRVGDEPKHNKFSRRLTKKLEELINKEFDVLQEEGGWHPSEAAGCCTKALCCAIVGMVLMVKNNAHMDDQMLSESDHEQIMDDLQAVIQKHFNKVASHLHQDN